MLKIRIAGQEPTANPTKILEAFQEFYSKLYNAPPQPPRDSITEFLDSLPTPSLDIKHRDILEAPFMVKEVMSVFKGLKKRSAPGPYGLFVPYYKAFAGTLGCGMVDQNNRVFSSHLIYRKPLTPCPDHTSSPRFMGLIHALYSYPKAQIHLQGHYSSPIDIDRGTRQGCPLSPIIFAVDIETLAIAICQNPDIKGVACGD